MLAVLSGWAPIEVTDTSELEVGDRIVIEFGWPGYLKFGDKATFTVTQATPEGIRFVGADGKEPKEIPMPVKGTRAQLVKLIETETEVKGIQVFRLVGEDAPPPDVPELKGHTKLKPGTFDSGNLEPGTLLFERLKGPDGGPFLTRIMGKVPIPAGQEKLFGKALYATKHIVVPPVLGDRKVGRASAKLIDQGTYSVWKFELPEPAVGWLETFPFIPIAVGATLVALVIWIAYKKAGESGE